MKRSELLKEIFYKLEMVHSHPEGNIKLANELLTIIEEAGMLPPLTMIEGEDVIYNEEMVQAYNLKNEWENEDET